jgi:hypothetical protein
MTENELKEGAKLMKLLREKFPEAHLTYFPVEQKYLCHVWGKPLGGMFSNSVDAIRDALKSE